MGHRVRLFVGSAQALKPLHEAAGLCGLYALAPAARLLVLPLDETIHERLHRSYGTGDWLEIGGPLLTSSDMAAAAKASEVDRVAYLETDYLDGDGLQHAVVWQGGILTLGPLTRDVSQSRSRHASLWPVNVALRSLGVEADMWRDEFTVFGLDRYRSCAEILSRASRMD